MTLDVTNYMPHGYPRQRRTPVDTQDFNSEWWTTSGGSTFIPSRTSSPTTAMSLDSYTSSSSSELSSQSVPDTSQPSGSQSGLPLIASSVFTSTFPITTVTQPTTTFTSFSESVISLSLSSTSTSTSNTASASAAFATTSPDFQPQSNSVCLGHGLDASAEGLLAALIVPSAIGLILWLTFSVLRPRYRQIYGLREWFVQADLRPRPLSSSFFAFLFPYVPLVPDVPKDVSDAGRSTSKDAALFPSDEQLNQRALWISLLIVLGWSILGLGGALPLYIVSTPCNAQLPSPSIFGGGFSTLQDLSLLRLLRLFDQENISTANLSSLSKRADDQNDPQHARIRIIVLTAIALVLGVLPALWKVLREFNKIVAYRQRWVEVKCEGHELGWLSASNAPGFVGWGEKRLKDYIAKTGLSSTLGNGDRRHGLKDNGARPRNGERRTRRPEEQPLTRVEHPEIDIQNVFSIGDTHHLALLIDERDAILENLEIAETRYIASFRVTTPDPSIADFHIPPPPDPSRPYISRPLPLGGPQIHTTRRRRAINRAFAASSLAPTSFVAPSSYYKLRGVNGVSGGRFTDSGIEQTPSLEETINSRVIGSRFLEVNRNSVAYGRLPLGSHVMVEKNGQLGPASPHESWLPPIPDPRLFGPNYSAQLHDVDEHGMMRELPDLPELDDEWVDLSKENSQDLGTDYNGTPPQTAGPSFLRRPPKAEPIPSARRETFPLRRDGRPEDPQFVPPPHLRLQPSQPFVRPLDGLNFDDLGHVYEDITQWRSRLKMINTEIADAQRECYNDIAEGTRVKGWIMVGKGLRFLPGIKLIEGRAKEDIRWDVLQNERTWLDGLALWIVVIVFSVFLAAGLTAATGLSLSIAPDFSHYLHFLRPLLTVHPLAAGIATVLAPAIGVTIFTLTALGVINWATHIYGSISISGSQLLIFKLTFFICAVIGTIWLVAIGAILFALQGLHSRSQQAQSIADGSIYMSVLLLAVILNVAIIFPACLLLQPFRLWRVLRAEKHAVTPRQWFRAVYPRTYNPSFAISACVLALVFASTFSLIFPLIGPAVVLLLLLTLVAHRYLVGYVYVRTHSQTGGLLQIWLLKRFGSILAFQPILLGLIFLSRRFWIEGGVCAGTGVLVIIFVEIYTSWKTRLPGKNSLSPIVQVALDTFTSTAKRYLIDDEGTIGNGSSGNGTRFRGSMASVLEMMSATLAVTPSRFRGPVPLQTETLDDLTATERAARTHPDAPPHLPPLLFTGYTEDISGMLYAPELVAPPPIIWLPNDSAGVARSEAEDLQKYHDLKATLDVRATDGGLLRLSISSPRRSSR